MHDLWLDVQLLLLLAMGNCAPIAAKRWLGTRWAWPLDAGLRLGDGRPVLGPSKTVRGVLVAVSGCTLLAPILGLPATVGALVGLGSMVGDALSSFLKRRLAIESGGQAIGLDQVPESLLALLAVMPVLDLSLLQIVAVTSAFAILEVPLARLAHRLGLRERPY